MTATADVTVAVVSWNTRELLLRALESALSQEPRPRRIIVVDNASADGSAEAAAALAGVEVIQTGANLGFGRGVNRAAAAADTEYLLLLNPDAILRPGALAAIVAAADAEPLRAAVGGMCVTSAGAVDPTTARRLPSVWSHLCYATGLNTVAKGNRIFDPEPMHEWDRSTARDVEMLSGALLLLRRSVFDDVGRFDERFFMYGEDADLSVRLQEAGFACHFTPDGVAEHDSGQASTSTGKMRLVLTGKATFVRKHWPGAKGRFGLGTLAAGVLVRRALAPVVRERDVDWPLLWRERRSWLAGYPAP